MKIEKTIFKIISVLLIGFLLNSCYNNVVVPRDQPINTHDKILNLIWLDPEIPEIYMLDNLIEDGKIRGIVHTQLLI